VPLWVTEIRHRVVDEAAPHDDVGLLIFDRFPCPEDTLAAVTAALGDPLRALVVEMSDELNPHDSMISKGPISDETERLPRETAASNPTVKSVERVGSTPVDVELNTNLTSAFVRWRHCHRKASQTARPPLKAALDPLLGLIFSHRLRHHREPGYVGIPARLGNSGRIADPERTQSDLKSGEGRIGRHEITHRDSVADTQGIAVRDFEDRSRTGVSSHSVSRSCACTERGPVAGWVEERFRSGADLVGAEWACRSAGKSC
jgi:hypothetical protein